MNSSRSEPSSPFISNAILFPDGKEPTYETTGTVEERYRGYDDFDSNIAPKLYKGTEEGKKQAIKITRTHYTKIIISCLDELSNQHDSVAIDSIMYMQQLLNCMREYVDNHYSDSFSSFVSTCYDALVFNDNWINLAGEQYQKIKDIFTDLNNRNDISYEQIDKSIAKLDKIGLDTTPF